MPMDRLLVPNASLVTTTELMNVSDLWILQDWHVDEANTTVSMTTSFALEGKGHIAVPWTWYPMRWTWWVILQLFFAILGIIGNLLVMIVLFNRPSLRRSTDILIGALAWADFLTSVCIIPHPQISSLPSETWLSQVYCRIVHPSFIMWIAVVASVFTLTIISLERYLAIAHPFFYLRHINSYRTFVCIAVIWAAAIATNIYQVVVGFAEENSCKFMFPSLKVQRVIGIFVFIVEFVLPMVVMVTAQLLTASILQKQSLRFRASEFDRSNANINHIIARKRIIQTLFLVTTVFIVCWGPDQIFFLMIMLSIGVLDTTFLHTPIHRFVVVLAFVNSCANVFIYTARYPEFRKSLWEMFRVESKAKDSPFGAENTKHGRRSATM